MNVSIDRQDCRYWGSGRIRVAVSVSGFCHRQLLVCWLSARDVASLAVLQVLANSFPSIHSSLLIIVRSGGGQYHCTYFLPAILGLFGVCGTIRWNRTRVTF